MTRTRFEASISVSASASSSRSWEFSAFSASGRFEADEPDVVLDLDDQGFKGHGNLLAAWQPRQH